MTNLKSCHKLTYKLICLVLCTLILGFCLAVFKPDGHKGSGYGSACLAHAGHSSPEGPGNPEGTLTIETKRFSKTGEDGL